jgi:hypothetical protein
VCVDTANNPDHCGGCDTVCDSTHATGVCVAGSCEALCDDGFGDCDASAGCELALEADENNCGGCGVTCAVDEACISGACQPRTLIALCGFSIRNVLAYLPAGPYSLVSTCAPDETYLAMFVSRSGIVDAAALGAFLDGGGIVLTEFSASDEVFSAAFTPVVQPVNVSGLCRDRIPTAVQYSPSDPFWMANTYQADPDGASGCGYDVSAYPGITPLAGWSLSTVSVAYRDRGEGRLWLTDFDWQDGEIFPQPYTEQLMQYMATHR